MATADAADSSTGEVRPPSLLPFPADPVLTIPKRHSPGHLCDAPSGPGGSGTRVWSLSPTSPVSFRRRLCVPPWRPVFATLWEGGSMAMEQITHQSSVMIPGSQGLWRGTETPLKRGLVFSHRSPALTTGEPQQARQPLLSIRRMPGCRQCRPGRSSGPSHWAYSQHPADLKSTASGWAQRQGHALFDCR